MFLIKYTSLPLALIFFMASSLNLAGVYLGAKNASLADAGIFLAYTVLMVAAYFVSRWVGKEIKLLLDA